MARGTRRPLGPGGSLRAAVLALLVLAAGATGAAAMEAKLLNTDSGSTVLLLEGPIRPGDGHKLLPKLEARNFREVWLHSPGGSVKDGYQIGSALRRLGVATRIPPQAICASACVDVFLGGVIRFVDSTGSIVIHPGSISGSPVASRILEKAVNDGHSKEAIQTFEQNATAESATWIRYLTMMGISLDLVSYAAQVPHRCQIVLRPKELVYFNVVNTAGAPPAGYVPSAPRIEGC